MSLAVNTRFFGQSTKGKPPEFLHRTYQARNRYGNIEIKLEKHETQELQNSAVRELQRELPSIVIFITQTCFRPS
jgi:hypothetical protein